MAHDVFICHATENKAIAEAIVSTLEDSGIRCWIAPRNIRPGSDYSQSIIDAISEVRVMVLVLSSQANSSEHVKREVERAVNKKITVIPFRIEDIPPSQALEYFISTTQWVNAFTPPLEEHYLYLADAIKELLSGKGKDLLTPPVKPKPGGENPARLWKITSVIASGVIAIITGIYLFLWNTNGSRKIDINATKTNIYQKSCEMLKIKTFPIFPYYLVNTYNKNPKNKYIYWVSVSGKNECPERLQIRLLFKPDPLKAKASKEHHDVTIDPSDKEIDERKDFGVKIIAKAEETFPLPGEWKILSLDNTTVDKTLRQDDFTIQVIADKHIYWDLKNPDGQPVDFGFLLASLSSWSELPRTPPQELGKRAADYLGQESDPDQWLRKCYNDLFRSDTAIKVQPFADPWPLPGEGDLSLEKIRSWEMILAEKQADPLEAALLMACLKDAVLKTKNLRFRLVLFALPLTAEKCEGEKQFLLAWSAKGKDWSAFDITAPNDLDFDQNVQQASAKLAEVLQIQGATIFPLLDKKGVFYDESKPLPQQTLLALDFSIAPRYFGIAGLAQE